jgi:hypothetical protein
MLSLIEILILIFYSCVGVLLYRLAYALIYSVIAKELKGVNFLYGFLYSLINLKIGENVVEKAVNSIRNKKDIVVNKDNFVSKNEFYKMGQIYNNVEKQIFFCDSISENIETVLFDVEVMMREVVESINTYNYLHSAKFINDYDEAYFKINPYLIGIGSVLGLFLAMIYSPKMPEAFGNALSVVLLSILILFVKSAFIVPTIIFNKLNAPFRYKLRVASGKPESPYSVTAVAQNEYLKAYIATLKLNKYCDEFSRKKSVEICKTIANVGSFEYCDFSKIFNIPPNANKFVVVYLLERVEGVEVVPIKGNESYLITLVNKSIDGNIRTEYLDEL